LDPLDTGLQIGKLRKQADARKQTAARSTRAANKLAMHVPDRARVRETTPDDIKTVDRFLALPAEEEVSES
jgi:hypothetical protein